MESERQKIGPLLVTPREAAQALSICERTLYALTQRGQLPTVRIGRAVRYDVRDLRAWIERAKKPCRPGADGI